MMPVSITAAWEQFDRQRTDDARNRFVEAYMSRLKRLANAMSKRLPVETDDLVQVAAEAIVVNIDSFDASLGGLESYFDSKARHAMLDSARASAPGQRTAVRVRREASSRFEQAAQELGRYPTSDELVAMGLTANAARWVTSEYNRDFTSRTLSLDDPRHDLEGSLTIAGTDAESTINIEDYSTVIASALKALPREYRDLISAVYRPHHCDGQVKCMSMSTLAEMIGCSNATMSKIRDMVIVALRDQIAKQSGAGLRPAPAPEAREAVPA